MREENGNETINSRIKIDYSGVKPRVKFSYPDKKNQNEGNMFIYVIFGWLILNIPVLIFGVIWDLNNTDEKFNKEDYDLESREDFLEYYMQEERVNYSYFLTNHPIKVLFDVPSAPVFFLIYLIGGGPLVYFLFKKKWNSYYPDFQAFISPKKLITFKPKDVKKEGGNLYCEIPLFANVLLDYEATEDFSRYLKYFEIEEYKFKYHERKLFGTKKKLIKNEWMWYAKFYFSKPIKKGELRVVFK